MFPALIVSPLVGGPIADFFDKRRTMVILDVLSTVVAGLLFPLAARMQSKFVLYFSVLLLATVDAIYNPVKNSILPFMLKSDEEVRRVGRRGRMGRRGNLCASYCDDLCTSFFNTANRPGVAPR